MTDTNVGMVDYQKKLNPYNFDYCHGTKRCVYLTVPYNMFK